MQAADLQKKTANPARLLVFFGMTASGKSTLAEAWASAHQAPYYNTDRVRKELAGLQATAKRPDGINQGIYSAALTAQTYQALCDRAEQNLTNGTANVVLDGSYSRRQDRDQVRHLAGKTGACCLFFFCACTEIELRRRLKLRAEDPEAVSDGRWMIYLHQKEVFERPTAAEEDCIVFATDDTPAILLDQLEARLAALSACAASEP